MKNDLFDLSHLIYLINNKKIKRGDYFKTDNDLILLYDGVKIFGKERLKGGEKIKYEGTIDWLST